MKCFCHYQALKFGLLEGAVIVRLNGKRQVERKRDERGRQTDTSTCYADASANAHITKIVFVVLVILI